MSEEGGIIGALCALCCFSNLQAWCDQKAFGGNGCCGTSGQAGCCNSCCDDSFNEDSFDRDKPQNDQKPVDSQPPAAENMTAPTTQDKSTAERTGQGPTVYDSFM
ncbi:hypothetical protein PILCRDRAFT_118973 [Piloderma croceum F 1598]|uniref:Uncharacterized protein n=1 Tax=Piloderma croceum (strain F 1598) TaxID=765440 RepID=A0A0C3GL71_PILCF|nr:hypothetical protein PILCRDRAFT_118973 [Piloderma croceum F 1598]